MFNLTNDKTYKVNVSFINEEKVEELFKTLYDTKVFTGNNKQVLNNLNLENEGEIYLGLDIDKVTNLDLRMQGSSLGKLLQTRKVESVNINLDNLTDDYAQFFFEGFLDSFYKFEYYKKEKSEVTLKNINVSSKLNVVNNTFNLMKGVYTARDLVNYRANTLYPESYANIISDLFKETNVEVLVYNKEQIIELGMHALLEVNKGSNLDPRFVVLKYIEDKDKNDHLTVVGKSVTYDSGGYAIKPGASMASMNTDMAGSAAVVGLFHALTLNKPKTNVVGVITMTENLIDGGAYKNGDIIDTMKGLKVEVINTDAEGRLTLADSIYYAATKLNSREIIELSTLTGACIAAFGNEVTGITTEDDALYERVHEAGLVSGEFNWRMPMTDSLKDSVKSDVADLKNAVPGGGGMMTAGIFLNHFNEDIPFIHLDIAGTSTTTGKYHLPKGATGVGVKTLYNYIIKFN